MTPLSRKFILLLILATAIPVSAQRRYVVWTGDEACGQRGSGIAADESISCSSVETPRGRVSSFAHDGLTLTVAFVEQDDYIILGVHIRNDTGVTIQFDSDKWGAAHFESLEALQVRKKPIAAETSIPYRDLIRNARALASKDVAIDTYMADQATTMETKRRRREDGTVVTNTVMASDEEAARLARERSISRQTLAAQEKERYREGSLDVKWLSPGGHTKGLVYFRKYDKAGLVIFSLKVDGTVYIFRLPRSVD